MRAGRRRSGRGAGLPGGGQLPPAAPPAPLRFGITPEAAGSAGAAQGTSAPVDEAKPLARCATCGARPRPRPAPQPPLLVRRAGRDRALRGARRPLRARRLQHRGPGPLSPARGRTRATSRLGGLRPRRGAHARRAAGGRGALDHQRGEPADLAQHLRRGVTTACVDAILRGVVAARSEARPPRPRRRADRIHLRVALAADTRPQFWRGHRRPLDARLPRALDYVGVQVYPGLVWPPRRSRAAPPATSRRGARRSCATATCRKAGLGRDVDALGQRERLRDEPGAHRGGQAADDLERRGGARAWSGALGLTDYRWFNLRDNDSDRADLFAPSACCATTTRRKPAFATCSGG